MSVKARATTVAVVVLALLAVLQTSGCVSKSSVQKMDLIGQLKRINKEVSALNDKTVSLVDVIQALDVKESQLSRSVELLESVDGKTAEQLSTTRELSSIVQAQKAAVAGVLGAATAVLSAESELKKGTESQLSMAGATLHLVNVLMGNLNEFKSINEGISDKMDQALDIMSGM